MKKQQVATWKGRIALLCLTALAALAAPGVRGTSHAFHDGGVAACEACHTMHNSLNAAAITTAGGASQFQGHASLLKGSDPSSTCLNCHKGVTYKAQVMSSAVGATGLPAQMTPGGDFAWLNISTSYVTSGGSGGSNPGTRHGHNIVAADYVLLPSPVFAQAPGGSYPSANLHCTSCHDPHGEYRVNNSYQIVTSALHTDVGPIKDSGSYGTALPTGTDSVGVYRLLGGAGYLPGSMRGNPLLAFANQPPFAFSPTDYNRAESTTDTRVAYGSGMSEWCGNCHGGIHGDSLPTNQPHPTGNTTSGILNSALSSVPTDTEGLTIAARYNRYLNSDPPTGLNGTAATSYTSMVPYEEGLPLNAANYAALATRAVSDGLQKGGPTYYSGGNERVMCLTCHRAHASAWPKILRWNAEYGQYLTVQGMYPGIDSGVLQAQGGEYNLGYLQAQVQRSFYDRPASVYAAFQKSLCKKCHNTISDF